MGYTTTNRVTVRFGFDTNYDGPRKGRFLPGGTSFFRNVDIGGGENAA